MVACGILRGFFVGVAFEFFLYNQKNSLKLVLLIKIVKFNVVIEKACRDKVVNLNL